MAIYNFREDKVCVEDIIESHNLHNKSKKIAILTDMDHTMFNSDLGVDVFLEKCGDIKMWEMDVHEFASLLLPRKYKEIFNDGLDGRYTTLGLTKDICQFILGLSKDLKYLYRYIQVLLSQNGDQEELGVAVKHFARKMMEFDRVFVEHDMVLQQHFTTPMLMRTRFFAGKNSTPVVKLTRKVMERTRGSADRFVDLNFDVKDLPGREYISSDFVDEIHGKESPYKVVDRYAAHIQEVVDLIRYMVEFESSVCRVISGNLEGIAKTAVENSEYRFLLEQGEVRKTDVIKGTRLKRNNGRFATMPKMPILGPVKVEKAMSFAEKYGKKTKIALGDSKSDAPMLNYALESGGLSFVVGQDFRKAIEKFTGVLDIRKETLKRIFYVIHNGKEDGSRQSMVPYPKPEPIPFSPAISDIR
ncbi:hypothetical protein GF340_02940 [Candidatus Peregrinibacteria bacterium]|nr:hypothetical protein [Candidatus Peregrinibacteria bacterium]